MSESSRVKFAWNVPNILTIIRIVLVPVFFIVLILHPHDQQWRLWSAAIFCIAILTDTADGYIARKYDLVTDFGKIFDPIADKALTGLAFIGLSIISELPWVMTIIILIREQGITFLRMAVLKYGVIAANRGGKLKTVLQSIALMLFLLWLPQMGTAYQMVKWTVMWAAFLMTIITGLDYVRAAWILRRDALAASEANDADRSSSHSDNAA